MTDPTIEKFRSRLAEARADIQRLKARMKRSAERLEALQREEAVIVEALEMVGADVPEINQATIAHTGARKRRSSKIRAIDAALQVVVAGEEVSKEEVARRVHGSNISFESMNPPNALATAMSRSPQFKNLGRGLFKRLEDDEIEFAAQQIEAMLDREDR